VSEVEEHLQEVARAIKSAQAHGSVDFAGRMGLKSLLGLQAELQEEVQAAKMAESKKNGKAADVESGDSILS
jgi:hypothetical protein